MEPPDGSQALDNVDLAILEIVQADASKPHRAIAEQVNLSTPAVQRRLKRMSSMGVIEQTIAVVDPKRFGNFVTICAHVVLNSERLAFLDRIKLRLRRAPEVQQCYYVTGDADLIVIVNVPSMDAYEAFTREYFFDDDNVKRFQSYVVMQRVKVGLSLPINP